jgi:hypothetical protein
MTHTYPFEIMKSEGLRYWSIKQGTATVATCHAKTITTEQSIEKLKEAYTNLAGSRVTISIFNEPPAHIKRGDARTNTPIYTWSIDIPGIGMSENKTIAPAQEHGIYTLLIHQMQSHNEAMRLEMEKRHELQLELIKQQADKVAKDEEAAGIDTNKLIELIAGAIPHLMKGGGAVADKVEVKQGWNDVISEFEKMGGRPEDFAESVKQMRAKMSAE